MNCISIDSVYIHSSHSIHPPQNHYDYNWIAASIHNILFIDEREKEANNDVKTILPPPPAQTMIRFLFNFMDEPINFIQVAFQFSPFFYAHYVNFKQIYLSFLCILMIHAMLLMILCMERGFLKDMSCMFFILVLSRDNCNGPFVIYCWDFECGHIIYI